MDFLFYVGQLIKEENKKGYIPFCQYELLRGRVWGCMLEGEEGVGKNREKSKRKIELKKSIYVFYPILPLA